MPRTVPTVFPHALGEALSSSGAADCGRLLSSPLVYWRHPGLFVLCLPHCCLPDLPRQLFFSFPPHPHKFTLKRTQHLFHVYLKHNQKTKCGYIIAQWYIITRDKNKGYNTSHQCPKILGLEGSQETIYSKLYLSFMQRKNKNVHVCIFRVYTRTQKNLQYPKSTLAIRPDEVSWPKTAE